MLRHRGAQHVVHAEELADEVAAVQLHHRIVPERRHGEEKREPSEDVPAEELAQPPLPREEQEDDEPRQAEANRPFREHGDAGEEKGEVVPAHAPLRVAEVEGDEHTAQRDEERRVGDHRMADVPELDGRPHDERREPADALPIEPPPEEIREEEANQREQRGEEPRRKRRLPEERECRDELPVEEHGLIVPVVPVDARREEVARRHHLLGGLDVIRLHGVRDDHRRIAHEIDEHGEEEKQRHMTPRDFPFLPAFPDSL